MHSAVRSVVAVVIGLAVMVVMKIYLTPMLLKAMGIHSSRPSSSMLFFAVYAIFIFAIATMGGFVTGALARVRPIEHAAALVGVSCVLAFLTYRPSPGIPPSWYEWMIGFGPGFFMLTGAAFYTPGSSRSGPRTG
jgi:hypothetical protein